MSKRPVANPIEEALEALSPAEGVIRVCMGHGAVDLLAPDRDAAGVIAVASVERALAEGKVHFVALGDRHSLTRVGSGERVWYSGTPESTDFSEIHSGFALVAELGEGRAVAKEVRVGQWRFLEQRRVDLNTIDDVEALRKWLEEVDDKERTIVRLHLVGSLTLSLHAALQDHLLGARDVFGALETREEDFLVLPDDADFAGLGFSGFAGATVQRLRGRIAEGGDEAATARDALMLLLRLAGGTA
jgi:DNA repair exonuclease SbcCD nuclease subunit